MRSVQARRAPEAFRARRIAQVDAAVETLDVEVHDTSARKRTTNVQIQDRALGFQTVDVGFQTVDVEVRNLDIRN